MAQFLEISYAKGLVGDRTLTSQHVRVVNRSSSSTLWLAFIWRNLCVSSEDLTVGISYDNICSFKETGSTYAEVINRPRSDHNRFFFSDNFVVRFRDQHIRPSVFHVRRDVDLNEELNSASCRPCKNESRTRYMHLRQRTFDMSLERVDTDSRTAKLV